MQHTSQTRFAASGGAVLLTLAAFVLLVSVAQAAAPLTQLQRAHAGADVTYAAAPLSQLQRAHGNAEIVYAAAPLSQLQRAHGSADIAYAVAPLSQLQRAPGGAAVTYAAAGLVGSTLQAGRGGVFPRAIVRTTPVAESPGQIIGGIAVVALVIALIALLALGSRGSRRGQLAAVTSLGQAPSASPAAQHDERERKAA